MSRARRAGPVVQNVWFVFFGASFYVNCTNMKVAEKNVMRLAAVQQLRAAYGIKIKNWSKNKAASCKSNSVSKRHSASSRLNTICIKRLTPSQKTQPHLFGGRCHPCLSRQTFCLDVLVIIHTINFLTPKPNTRTQRAKASYCILASA